MWLAVSVALLLVPGTMRSFTIRLSFSLSYLSGISYNFALKQHLQVSVLRKVAGH